MNDVIGLIVGTGAAQLELKTESRSPTKTPYGVPSSALQRSTIGGRSVICIARHGETGSIPPHLVNYRANIWALREHGADAVIGINAVGIIDPAVLLPGQLAVPDQLIDYTWGREHTFETGDAPQINHVDFTEPFDAELRGQLADAAATLGVGGRRGTYGVTQGPRLETAAEIDRLAGDGCVMVGMTAMPEAGLARECGLRYAICAVGVNRAAGRDPGGGDIHADIAAHIATGMAHARAVLDAVVPAL
jgi:5'-methylthioinosine phosphorylase